MTNGRYFVIIVSFVAILEFKNVSFAYPTGDSEIASMAVKNVSFSVEKGDFVALVGRNGSGKSTVAKLCDGLFLPDEGDVFVNGMNTLDKKCLYSIRKTVGVVFQNPDNQTVATIIEDDVAFGPENLGLKSEEIRERVDGALKAVGMTEYAKSSPFRLSGGQKQRVAIAGVLAINPEVIVLDEATSMLDPDGREDVMKVVRALNEQGMTVIMITHFMEEAALCNKIFVMDGGEIIMSGGKEIFERERELIHAGLDVPIAARVANRLRDRGVDIGKPLLIDDLVDELCR